MSSIEDLLKDPNVLKGGHKKSTASDDDAPIESKTTSLERKVAAIGIQEQENKAKAAADRSNIPYIDFVGFPISPDTLTILDRKKAKELKVISFLNIGEEIRFGAVNPDDPRVKELAFQIGESRRGKVQVYKISNHSFDVGYKIYDKVPIYKKPVSGVQISQKDMDKYKDIGADFKQLQATVEKTNITDLVTLIIAASISAGSSDIHIEAEEKDVKIRFRVDGILHDAAKLDKSLWPKIISRVKLLSKLKLNVTDKPQDGRFTIVLTKEKIDVRVSTIPTSYGESVVMRLLKSSAAGLEFEQLGLIGIAEKRLKEQAERPNGMIITTGPTGSGKTTTLYAILNKLNVEGTKIITLEDPIEYRLEGINQSGIDHSKDYSFADGLRSILRQDPDVVMVGEMRDLETAGVAINAALTGHLVISTIHTNSASGAIPRFLAMGVKGFLLAPALNAIMGQRLVRRICEACKEEYTAKPEEIAKVTKLLEAIPADHPDRPNLENMTFMYSKGCKECNNMGYKGRIGIYEIMIMSPEIEKVILSDKVSEYEMQRLAIEAGMLTMVQDGLIKALKGITTIEEVFRVSE